MPTTIKSIVTQVRAHLVEPVPRFWSDQELVDIMQKGAVDLWGAILDLHQDHYFRLTSPTNPPVLKANATEISNIPDNCFRIQLIEPLDTQVTTAGHQIMFVPRKYNHPDFIIARTFSPQDPSSTPARQIYYQITGLGPPIEAPHVITAPVLSQDLNLRIAYNPSLPILTLDAVNPVPGDTDNALKAWTIAFARAKESEGKQPDAGWLSIYATDKQTTLTRLTPREEQEPEVVEDLFQGYGSLW